MGGAERQATKLILVSGPGTKARHLELPRGFPLWVVLGVVLSTFGSLLVGRQARAWFDGEEAQAPWSHTYAEQAFSASLEDRSRERYAADAWVPWRPPPVDEARTEEPGRSESEARVHEAGELALFDINTHKGLLVRPFDALGRPSSDAFAALRSFMRCRRTGDETEMDPRLVRVLLGIAHELGGARLHVISGHRAPDGVVTSPSSQHVRGTAADIRVPGVSLDALEQVARAQGARGIGVYTRQRFVHVDVRERAYSWRDDGRGDASDGSDAARMAP